MARQRRRKPRKWFMVLCILALVWCSWRISGALASEDYGIVAFNLFFGGLYAMWLYRDINLLKAGDDDGEG